MLKKINGIVKYLKKKIKMIQNKKIILEDKRLIMGRILSLLVKK